jgi:hypothetical protein
VHALKKIALILLGLIGVLLGGLWALQGLGLLHLEPIACVAECEPLEGSSPMWAAIGIAVFALGAFSLFQAFRRGSPRA